MAAEKVPLYVINRAPDAERLAIFAAAAEAQGASFTRIEALDGHDPAAPLFLYRTLARDAFWGEDQIKPGAFACAVSHMNAWRRMLAEGAEAALICEDDTRLCADPDAFAAAARRYRDIDIVFANRRLADWRAAGKTKKSDPTLIPVAKVLKRMEDAGAAPGENGLARAPGADAYLVTRAGAEKLIDLVNDVGIVAGVDWLMLAAALEAPAAAADETRYLLDRIGDRPRLNALVAADPVADLAGGPSAIRHQETIPLSRLRDGPSINGGAFCQSPPNLRPDPVAGAFANSRFYEEPALAMMARWMPRGGTFVDVGAHVGNHTLFMLAHGGAGRAIPLEPNAHAIAALHDVLAMNGLTDRIDGEHLGYGLAEDAGKRETKGGKRNPFRNRLKPGFDEGAKVRPGDALIRTTEVAMIKVDVNGEEREALKGLRKTLNRQSPLLVVDMTRPRSAKALPLIERLGYRELERATWDEGEDPRLVVLYAKPA